MERYQVVGHLRLDPEGTVTSYADAQATVEALQAQRDEQMRTWWTLRGVEVPCVKCDGAGWRSYASTATWRGGIGGQAITSDVCDECWGSGDMHKKGTNLRKMRQQVEVLQARVQELEARQHFGACAKCLTNAWRICKEGTPDAVEMKCSNGSTWWLCDYCLSKEQLTQRTAEVEALQAQVKQLEHGLTTQADAADMWYDEFLRIRALNASPEINGICDRALDGIPRTVPVVQENHQLRQQVEALQREHSQLQALVRALPVQEVDPGLAKVVGVTFAGQAAEAMAHLMTYRATLDALTPAGGGQDE